MPAHATSRTLHNLALLAVAPCALAACATVTARPAAPFASSTPVATSGHGTPGAPVNPAWPGLADIRQDEIRRDLFYLASDSMRGREAGTLDELRASMWIADRAREAGLEPAGDDGTFFQFWPMRRTRLSSESRIVLSGRPLALWQDVVVTAPITTTVDLPLVFMEASSTSTGNAQDLAGKAAVAVITSPLNPPDAHVSLRAFRYVLSAMRQQSQALIHRGAAAVILVSDSLADTPMGIGFAGTAFARGRYGLDTGRVEMPAGPQIPIFWVRHNMLDALRAPNQRLVANLVTETFSYPSVNIVGRVRGTDPARRDEYVLFSGHQDHDGVRFPIDGDSIWSGADDNASTSVGMLAIVRAFSRHPAPRSALFVWHGAEERGLLGSRWYSMRPTVPKSAIVAVLNGDMIGRNTPDSAALLGTQPPHRNSTTLVNDALAANAAVTHFIVDTTWDRPTHPEGWYFRSDHLPYARVGIPALFFSTLLHPDYHTPRDKPSRIDVAKLTRMAQWMYATGWTVANAAQRPAIDPGFKLER